PSRSAAQWESGRALPRRGGAAHRRDVRRARRAARSIAARSRSAAPGSGRPATCARYQREARTSATTVYHEGPKQHEDLSCFLVFLASPRVVVTSRRPLELPQLGELQEHVVRVHPRDREADRAVAESAAQDVVAEKREERMEGEVDDCGSSAGVVHLPRG